MKSHSSVVSGVFGLAWIALSIAPPALATVSQYKQFVDGHVDTIAHYDFDGGSDAVRREDKVGINNLVEKGTGTPTYGQSGLDNTSQAVRTGAAGSDNGSGFFTSTPIDTNASASVSFECIVFPLKDPTVSDNGYVVGAFDGTDRGYFLVMNAGQLVACAGNNFLNNRCNYVSLYTQSNVSVRRTPSSATFPHRAYCLRERKNGTWKRTSQDSVRARRSGAPCWRNSPQAA